MSAAISEPGAEAAETSVSVKKPSGGGLGRYVLIRFLLIIPTIFILTTLVFFLMRITGDPITAALGGRLTKAQLAERVHAAGYDRPILVQYFEYLGNLLKGDFGTAVSDGQPVSSILLNYGAATVELVFYALIVAFILGIPLGMLAAYHRLLHGDVGSGKTLVALRAMLTAVDSGAQAAMLAPTEVLAAQHYHSIQSLLHEQMALSPLLSDDDQVTVALMTGSMPAKERRGLALDLVAGNIDIVVGTHALLSESTMFAALGLIVVDEQHRFGVEQREAMRAKGGETTPHTLVMSATPIPRTVAMTVFADLDISTLDEMPAGPKDIATHVVPIVEQPAWYARVRELMRQTVEDERGVFVVFPRIEPMDIEDPESGEVLGQKQGIEDITRKLQETPELSDKKFGLLHGRMSAAEKDRVLADFVRGDIEILVSTTVIEVGVDVARATMMVIIEAENFGVAQLHQLRGRVGRDGSSAMCFLLTEMSETDESYGRLQAVAETLDGFALAEYDLEARGEGDVLSGSQWGGSSLRHLSILRDSEIVAEAKTIAEQIVAIDPTLEAVPALKAFIRRVLPEDDAHFIEAG